MTHSPLRAQHRLRRTARRMQPDDVAMLLEWMADPTLQEVIEDEDLDEDETGDKWARVASSDPFRDRQVAFVIEADGRPVGLVHLMWINWISRTAEIDLFAAPQRPRAGFWVVQKCGEIAFDLLNLHKIYGFVYAGNPRSLDLLARLASVEVTMSSALARPRGRQDVHIVSIFAHQYRAQMLRIGLDPDGPVA